MTGPDPKQRWAGTNAGTPLGHAVFRGLIALGGPWPAYALLVFVALYYLFKPSMRARAKPYLAQRFPKAPALVRLFHAYVLFFRFGQILVDKAVLGITGRFSWSAPEWLNQCIAGDAARGKGVVMLSAHVGCWQSAMAGMGFIPQGVSIVWRREQGDQDRPYFEHGSGHQAPEVIDPTGELGGVLEMMDALKRGRLLCLTGDRTFENDPNAVDLDFLGRRARLSIKAYALASATGAPVYVLFSRRTGPARARLECFQIMRPRPRLGRNPEAYRPHAEAFAKALEDYVESFPYQFFNFYQLWETDQ